MNNIDSIKEYYKVGDPIRIKCSLGIKEGYILGFTDDRIKIRPFVEGRKPISISEDNIEDFEEPEMPSSVAVPSTPVLEQQSESSKDEVANALFLEADNQVVIEKKSDQPSFVKGYVDLNSIYAKEKKRTKSNHSSQVFTPQSQPDPICPPYLETMAHSYMDEEANRRKVPAVGCIMRFGSKGFGFIRDQGSKDDIIFSESEICDEQLQEIENKKNIYVSYIKINGTKGRPQAVGITLPRPTYQLLAMAEYLKGEKGGVQKADYLLGAILNDNPDNEDAKNLRADIRIGKIWSYKQHSATSPLNEAERTEPIGKKENSPNTEKYRQEYKTAKSLINQKRHEEALRHYLAVFQTQKTDRLVKDISMVYCSLCGKKFNKENSQQAERYRKEGKDFLSKYEYLLPKGPSRAYSLETFYYVFREYEKYIEVVNEIIKIRVPSKCLTYMFKKAAVLSELKRKDEAIAVLNEALKIDPENNKAEALLLKIKSNQVINITDYDGSDNPIGCFLQEIIDNYNQYYGVVNKKIGDKDRLLSDATYKSIEDQIEKAKSDSRTRSQLLLTKIKLDIERSDDGIYDKKDFALYCNDKARITILDDPNAPKWDVVRFYFIESFSLTLSWDSTETQLIQYLKTFVPSKKTKIFDQALPLKNELADYITKYGEKDMEWIAGLLHPSLYNGEISNRIAHTIFDSKDLLELFRKEKGIGSVNEEKFLTIWQNMRNEMDTKLESLRKSYLSKKNQTNLERFCSSLSELNENTDIRWLFPMDNKRIRDFFKILVPKVDQFRLSNGYQSKEDRYNDANSYLKEIIKDIRTYPTKFSYEVLLPLLEHIEKLMNAEWEQISKASTPEVDISLLTSQAYKNYENKVQLQIAVKNGESSSPIGQIKLSVDECQFVNEWNFDEEIYSDLLRGGEQPILFHLNLTLSPDLTEKAFSISVICTYNTHNGKEAKKQPMSIRFYSEKEYNKIDNPYNAGDTVRKRDMFFGRGDFIENLINVMRSSPDKQLIFYGQKRSGKSSVLYWLEERLREEGAFCVRFSLGGIGRDLRDVTFFHKILNEINKNLKRFDGDKPSLEIPNITVFESEDPGNPVQTFSKYMEDFKNQCKKIPGWKNKLIVVMIDEFTYIYSGIKRGTVDETIMQQWKSVIQNPDSSFAAILVGQDVIPYFKEEKYARNVFQMMTEYRLNYLADVDARDLVEKPIGKDKYAIGTVDLILQLTACSPYYIQMICSDLVDEMNEKSSVIATTADVKEVVEKKINKLSLEQFDNLISPGDSIAIEGVTEKSIKAVLYRISKLTENKEYCKQSDIESFDDKSLMNEEHHLIVDKVLKDLYSRDVIERKEDMYKIKVKLFQLCLLKQPPQIASL